MSTLPMIHGESIVLRLLRKDAELFSFESIGMDNSIRSGFESLLELKNGMILVVGPTGSGKTTTLYCALNKINTRDRKIITIEDPVEYQVPGITQVQIQPKIGLTFANTLRHIVRQDPDIILIGEIRDRETAEIAIHAALTGHLVLSTLHTNDAAGTIARLQDMGLENFLISSALAGILSQRLVRTLCPECDGNSDDCRRCNGTGFAGRAGIYEYLPVTNRIRESIRDGLDRSEIERAAIEQGMQPLHHAGMTKVESGLTTKEEVVRVCSINA